MRIVYKIILFAFVLFLEIYTSNVSYQQVALFLIFSIIDVIYEKYNKNKFLILAQTILLLIISFFHVQFVFLFPKVASDIYTKINKKYIFLLCLVALPFINQLIYTVFYIVLSLLSFIIITLDVENTEIKIKYRYLYDKERMSKYNLEDAYVRLERLSSQVAQIAEINERNRIAREIHDNLGHNIAGVLFQLQAAKALVNNNDPKGLDFLENSISKLSEGLDILRNTVHNLKPNITYDFNYIKSIIDSYSFCKVVYNLNGPVELVKSYHTEAIAMVIKEALTNVLKHSNATLIEINIDIYKKFIRLFIKDNGNGAKKIIEGMGLKNIKERIRNIGGEVSFSSNNGFMIVAIIPLFDKIVDIRGE